MRNKDFRSTDWKYLGHFKQGDVRNVTYNTSKFTRTVGRVSKGVNGGSVLRYFESFGTNGGSVLRYFESFRTSRKSKKVQCDNPTRNMTELAISDDCKFGKPN